MSSRNFCFLFLFLVFCVSALTNVVCPAQGNPKPLRYELDKVTLVGTIVSRTFYGPPNYGEDPKIDSKERQFILLLDSPIDVIGNLNDPINKTERAVKKVTLVVFDFKAHPVEYLLGRRVEVEGILFHSHTGHHHTKVLIEIASIRRLSRTLDASK